jgi:hypothetical protein
MHTEFEWKNLKGRDSLKELDIDGWVTLKWMKKEWGVRM